MKKILTLVAVALISGTTAAHATSNWFDHKTDQNKSYGQVDDRHGQSGHGDDPYGGAKRSHKKNGGKHHHHRRHRHHPPKVTPTKVPPIDEGSNPNEPTPTPTVPVIDVTPTPSVTPTLTPTETPVKPTPVPTGPSPEGSPTPTAAIPTPTSPVATATPTPTVPSTAPTPTASVPTPSIPPEGGQPGSNNASPLGMNLSGVTDYSPEYPFVDAFKASRPWISGSNAAFDDGRIISVDEFGWVKSLQPGQVARTVLFNTSCKPAAGELVVLYSGSGKIEYSGAARLQSSAPGRDVVTLSAGPESMLMYLTETDPNNPIRDIHVVPIAKESTYQTQPFTDAFLAKLRPFSVLRFFEWNRINDTAPSDWGKRAKLTDARWAENGVPYEIIVQLANQLHAEPWISVPHGANNEYMTSLGTLLHDSLDSSLKAWIEYSNEVWNPDFPAFAYAREQGLAQRLATDPTDAVHFYYAKRAAEIMDQFTQALGSGRLVRVLGGQSVNTFLTQQLLSVPGTASHFDVFGIGPYLGTTLGWEENRQRVRNLTVDQLIAELSSQWIPASRDEVKAQADVLAASGLKLVAAEGGTSLRAVGVPAMEDTQLNALFDATSRDPRMTRVYTEYLSALTQAGITKFLHFTDVSTFDKFGRFGALECVFDATSPRYQGLLDFITASQPPSAP